MGRLNEKYIPYRNPKILGAANGESCTMSSPECNGDSATTVFCHSNMIEDGKGVGKKADDCFGFFGCSSCHKWYDEGKAPSAIKVEYLHRAMKKTWKRLLQKGVLLQ